MIKNVNGSEWETGLFTDIKMETYLVCFITNFINLNKQLKHKQIFNI